MSVNFRLHGYNKPFNEYVASKLIRGQNSASNKLLACFYRNAAMASVSPLKVSGNMRFAIIVFIMAMEW